MLEHLLLRLGLIIVMRPWVSKESAYGATVYSLDLKKGKE